MLIVVIRNSLLLQRTAMYLQFSFLFICRLYMTQQLLLLALHVCYASLQFLYPVGQSH